MSIGSFLEEARQVMRLEHMSLRTEETYLLTMKRSISFQGKRRPRSLRVPEIRAYLSHLATEKEVAASTQNVAFNALLFLYRDVLHMGLPAIEGVERARRPARLPVVFTRAEVQAVLSRLQGQYVFPAGKLSVDPRSGQTRRHHLAEDVVQRAFHRAIGEAGIDRQGSCHTLRHSFATHRLEDGYDK